MVTVAVYDVHQYVRAPQFVDVKHKHVLTFVPTGKSEKQRVLDKEKRKKNERDIYSVRLRYETKNHKTYYTVQYIYTIQIGVMFLVKTYW